MPLNIGRGGIAPLVAQFATRSRASIIEFVLTDSRLEALEEEPEVGIHAATPQDSSLVSRLMFSCKGLIAVAQGTPDRAAPASHWRDAGTRPGTRPAGPRRSSYRAARREVGTLLHQLGGATRMGAHRQGGVTIKAS